MHKNIQAIMPGLLMSITIAFAAAFVAEHYGGPTLLYALLLGMALNHISEIERYQPGLQFASRSVLRIGVALLGARITLDQIMALGPRPLILVVIGVPLTIGSGLLLARWLGQKRSFGALTGVAVAICGASAAMAMASILPRHKDSESYLIFTVIAVTTLSTAAMIIYPLITRLLELDPLSAGIFLGGTIHDVAQVVGAGYLLGEEAGDTATFTKLLRVTMLVPTVVVMSLMINHQRDESTRPSALIPGFLLVFVFLVIINSAGWIPTPGRDFLSSFSRWCLITAIAAVGVKARMKELSKLGWKPLVMVVGETVFLATLGLLMLTLNRDYGGFAL